MHSDPARHGSAKPYTTRPGQTSALSLMGNYSDNPPMDLLRKQRRGETKVTNAQLVDALDSAISSQDSAELAVLHLLNCYDFDIASLLLLLQEKGLNVSFSKVSYNDIASKVGLDHTLACNDMPTFEIHRARIPNLLFKSIVEDLEVVMNQYGEPLDHKNEEAGSRFLAPLFNRTIALFKLTIRNTLGSVIPCRNTTRVEYHFLAFGVFSILVIQVKYVLGRSQERLDAIAQVIAECDACDYANDRLGFAPFPVYGILCDGSAFEFFSFDGSTIPFTFSRGVFRPPNDKPLERLALADYQATPVIQFISSLRPICETLFYFLLLAYQTGIQAYTQRSVLKSIRQRRSRESTPSWKEAGERASQALTLAVEAAAKAAARDPAANEMAATALEHLQQSFAAVPTSAKKVINLLAYWDEDALEFC